jgi:hypothetical protein
VEVLLNGNQEMPSQDFFAFEMFVKPLLPHHTVVKVAALS